MTRKKIRSRMAKFDPLPLPLPSWLSSAKGSCFMPTDLDLGGSGPRKLWRLRVSKSDQVILPKELLKGAGCWEGDEFRGSVGIVHGASIASDADGNAIVLRVLPHGLDLESKENGRAKQSVLQLNLHREFFAAIAAVKKRIEYRDRTPYWKTRLEGRRYDVICFRNGYTSNAPEMWVEWLGVRRYGTARRGYYAIRLGRILEIKRWRG